MNGLGEQRLMHIHDLRAEMNAWLKGEKSHNNLIRGTTTDPGWETMLIAQADAAEVVALSAAIQAESALAESLRWSA